MQDCSDRCHAVAATGSRLCTLRTPFGLVPAPCEMVRRLLLLVALLSAAGAARRSPRRGRRRRRASSIAALRARAHVRRAGTRGSSSDRRPGVRGRRRRFARVARHAGRRLPSARRPGRRRARRGARRARARCPASRRQPRSAASTGTIERTGATIGATWVRDTLGVDGTGVGVAIIDSGVANWHDDLGADRVVHFVDFVDFQPVAVRRLRPRHARRRHHRRQRLRLRRPPPRHRARRDAARRAKVLDGDGQRLHQQRHRRDRLRDREQGRASTSA